MSHSRGGKFKLYGGKSQTETSFPPDLEGHWVNHAEIHLVEHCNLNCKFCGHMSAIAEPSFYDVSEFESDMAKLSELTGSCINNIQLLGGEPLLHPRIKDIMSLTRKYFPYTNIDIVTNSLLLADLPDDFWKKVKENNIYVVPSVYPVKIDWKTIFKKVKKFGITFITDDKSEIITEKNLEKYKVEYFYKIAIDPDGKQRENNPICEFKNKCINFVHGKLYPCFVSSNIIHFNKKFGYNIPVEPADYADIYKVSSGAELVEFTHRESFPFCKYCGGSKCTDETWSAVPVHTVDEWLISDSDIDTEK